MGKKTSIKPDDYIDKEKRFAVMRVLRHDKRMSFTCWQPNLQTAEDEAERLADKNPGSIFLIMRRVGYVFTEGKVVNNTD